MTNFIAGIVAPHAKRTPEDEWAAWSSNSSAVSEPPWKSSPAWNGHDPPTMKVTKRQPQGSGTIPATRRTRSGLSSSRCCRCRPASCRGGGRPERHPRHNVVDAIRYVNDNGGKWRAVPVDFGIPWRTVYGFFQRWRASGALARIHVDLHERVRLHDGLNPRTVAVILDSQSVKAAETVGADTRGFDGGKLINGRKRHLIVDMRGMPLSVMVTPASPHDSISARDQLFRLSLTHPEVTVAWADSAYGATLTTWAHTVLDLTLKTVPRRKDRDGFAVLAKRWRVERTLSWITRARRNVRDYERLISHSEAHLTWTFITLMTRRLTRPP
ncbi:IS5 family transposase [Streptomyces chartreusis]